MTAVRVTFRVLGAPVLDGHEVQVRGAAWGNWSSVVPGKHNADAWEIETTVSTGSEFEYKYVTAQPNGTDTVYESTPNRRAKFTEDCTVTENWQDLSVSTIETQRKRDEEAERKLQAEAAARAEDEAKRSSAAEVARLEAETAALQEKQRKEEEARREASEREAAALRELQEKEGAARRAEEDARLAAEAEKLRQQQQEEERRAASEAARLEELQAKEKAAATATLTTTTVAVAEVAPVPGETEALCERLKSEVEELKARLATAESQAAEERTRRVAAEETAEHERTALQAAETAVADERTKRQTAEEAAALETARRERAERDLFEQVKLREQAEQRAAQETTKRQAAEAEARTARETATAASGAAGEGERHSREALTAAESRTAQLEKTVAEARHEAEDAKAKLAAAEERLKTLNGPSSTTPPPASAAAAAGSCSPVESLRRSHFRTSSSSLLQQATSSPMRGDADLTNETLRDAYLAVHDAKGTEGPDWLLLGYGSSSSVLSVYGTGSDGLSGLRKAVKRDELQYAYVRFHFGDQVGENNKFVCIVFTPDTLSGPKKYKATTHRGSIEKFFGNTSFTLQAVSLSDLEEGVVMKKLGVTSGQVDENFEKLTAERKNTSSGHVRASSFAWVR